MDSADLAIRQGNDYAATVIVENADGTAADLTAYTGARAQLRRAPADEDPEVAAEIVCTIVLPDQIRLSIPKSVTIALCGRYVWDLDLLPDELTIIGGKAVIVAEVTREVVLALRAAR